MEAARERLRENQEGPSDSDSDFGIESMFSRAIEEGAKKMQKEVFHNVSDEVTIALDKLAKKMSSPKKRRRNRCPHIFGRGPLKGTQCINDREPGKTHCKECNGLIKAKERSKKNRAIKKAQNALGAPPNAVINMVVDVVPPPPVAPVIAPVAPPPAEEEIELLKKVALLKGDDTELLRRIRAARADIQQIAQVPEIPPPVAQAVIAVPVVPANDDTDQKLLAELMEINEIRKSRSREASKSRSRSPSPSPKRGKTEESSEDEREERDWKIDGIFRILTAIAHKLG